MSVAKLLSRIIAHSSDRTVADKSVASSLHDHTYGIVSCPLTQFACILSALMHDVDHQGVPNSQLVKEEAPVAWVYKNKSVAEQNSIDVAWTHLMLDKFKDLRSTIYASDAELQRFRQLIVNSILSTDIMDADLKKLRNARWEKAFSEQDAEEDASVTTNRKATIVIEHLIQVSSCGSTCPKSGMTIRHGRAGI
jgi:3'5'-cyclic nucleotide phosphodiesterase